MRNLILNIGIGGEWPVEQAARTLELLPSLGQIDSGFILFNHKDEPVFVAYIRTDLKAPLCAIDRLALHLGQEAIAVWDADKAEGHIVGPQASLWLPFDNDKFFTWERHAAFLHSAPQAN